MNSYTYKNGHTEETPHIEIPKTIDTCFKVNLPSTSEEFENGNGEGVWACTTSESYQAWDEDLGGTHFVRILNTSVYYPGLTYGTTIPVEYRKGQKPVAILEELNHHYGASKRDEVIQFLMPKKNE